MEDTIVFFGSGPVAAKSLELLSQNFKIEAVITKPQPTHHREPFPVLVTAKRLGLQLLTPKDKKELSALFATKPVRSHLGIVIDYGFIINQDVIDYFPLGIINSHFSLLPEWRGADPISFAILSGQNRTGVSLMIITEKMDEGPLLGQTNFPLNGTETTPELTQSLIHLSDGMLNSLIPLYVAGAAHPVSQEWMAAKAKPSLQPTYSRKLTKNDGIIDWRKPAVQLEREIRAYIEWPKSRTTLVGKEVIITQATVLHNAQKIRHVVGDAYINNAGQLVVQTGKDLLHVIKIKPAGKPEMPSQAFLAGYGHLLTNAAD